MPELPEVETMCRCIAPAVGSRVCDVVRPKSRLQSITITPRLDCFRRRVVGKTIAAIRRIGKRVVLELVDGATPGLGTDPHPNPLPKGEGSTNYIVLEPRMTGLVLLAEPPNQSHVRLVFQLSGGRAEQILFWDQRGLGVARCLSRQELVEQYGPDRIGPDALTITPEELRARLGSSRRAIKVALLDQRAVAGIGNLYAAEIVHHAKIGPAMPCDRLRPADWARLHMAIVEILEAAIRHQGSTLRDGTYRIAQNTPGDYQLFHRVYGRAGEPCLRCGDASIVRIVQAQRSTFYCPACQRSCSSRRKR